MTNAQSKRLLTFYAEVGNDKRAEQGAQDKACPFCAREELEHVVAEDGPLLLVKNKYETLEHAFQTVLIETDECGASIETYAAAHMQRLITFGIDEWLKMEESGDYQSVLFFKNHGPYSGGSIEHAHMQIVGLEDLDYRLLLTDSMFEGVEIHREAGCEVNISSQPLASFIELNVMVNPRNDVYMANAIQRLVTYVLNHMHRCTSYNLFFYQWQSGLVCKITPRYITSPLLMGYLISQVMDDLAPLAQNIRKLVFD